MNWEKIAKERGEEIVALTNTVESKREMIASLVNKMLWVETANKLPDSFRPVIGFMEYSGAWTMRIVMLCDPQDAYQDKCWKTVEGNGTSVPLYWMPLPEPPAQFSKH